MGDDKPVSESRFQCALIISSSPLEGLSLRQLLQRAGIERVFLAEEVSEALTLMSRELVDLVFTCWDAPGLSGALLLQNLAERGRSGKVPVVILDFGLSQKDVVDTIKAGAAGRLTVPVKQERLKEILLKTGEINTTPAR